MAFASPGFYMPIPASIVYKTAIFAFFLLFAGERVTGQTTCKDEMLADPFFPCGTVLEPVCACDGVTYRNQCAARNHGGILSNQWVSGPCQDFFFFIYPNPSTQGIVNFQIQFRDRGKATMFLIDSYGKIMRQQVLDYTLNFPVTMDVGQLEAGVYYMLVRGDRYQQLERFVVVHF